MWFFVQYVRAPKRDLFTLVTNSYTAHAETINILTFLRQGIYSFQDTHTMISVGVQILLYNEWASECAQGHAVYVERILPAVFEHQGLFPGCYNRSIPRTPAPIGVRVYIRAWAHNCSSR